jgi:hypothetical protein
MTLSVRSQPRAPDVAALPSRAPSRALPSRAPSRAPSRFPARLRRRVAATCRQVARSRVLPAAVCAELAFERGERVLSVSQDRDGECTLVATDRALYHRVVPDGSDADGWSRLGWEQIARIGWDAVNCQLVVIGLAGAAPARTLVPLRNRGSVPELAQERVTHTKLGQWQLQIAGTGRVLIEARRQPVTGELLWFVIPDATGDGSGDIDVQAHVERAIARLCAEFGVLPSSEASPIVLPGGVDQVVQQEELGDRQWLTTLAAV